MTIKERRPELASPRTKAVKSFSLMVSDLPEKNSSHFLLLIQQLEEREKNITIQPSVLIKHLFLCSSFDLLKFLI